ncbi:MAG: helix-turn-helix domain-containing protein [Clostridiales Family XIII bacterium]|jgi:hypothetical protein|nr:helix-turn-helix domain-containing protein [Clostridiales Family XIII bacterium]
MDTAERKNVYKNEAAELLSALVSARNLQDIAIAGEKLFGNPLVITDHSWSVLAISSETEIPDDTAWNEFITFGTLSINTVALNIRNRLTERIGGSDEPFIWQDPGSRYRRLLGKVFIGQRVMATVSIMEYNRTFEESDVEKAKLFCEAVSVEMQKDRYKKYSRGLLYEDFISGVLEGRLSEGLIRERVRLFKLPLTGELRLFVIDSKGFDREDLSAGYLRDRIEKIMSLGMPVIYGGRILSVKSYADSADSYEEDVKKLESFLVENDIRCGVSRAAQKVTSLPDMYAEASAALRLGQRLDPKSPIYEYENYSIYRLCELCDEHEKGNAFLDLSLIRLIEYDREHGTEFTVSLKGWLDCSRNISNAASELHLHRNTLVYHLKRVEEIADISLTDPAKLMNLELSFKFLEYRGEY